MPNNTHNRDNTNPLDDSPILKVTKHHYNAAVDWPTSAIVLKEPLRTRLTDDQYRTLNALKEANKTADGNLRATESMEEGDRYTLEQLVNHDELDSPDFDLLRDKRLNKLRVQAEKERARKQKQERRDTLNLDVHRTWEDGHGEMHTLHANVTITDPDTDKSINYHLRNTVDVGFQVFPQDDEDNVDPDLDNRARKYLQEFSPIYVGHRQFPGDGMPNRW